jgi:hypothetical protein
MTQVPKVIINVLHLPAISLDYGSWDIDDVHFVVSRMASPLAPNRSLPLPNLKLQFRSWASSFAYLRLPDRRNTHTDSVEYEISKLRFHRRVLSKVDLRNIAYQAPEAYRYESN